MPKMRKLHYDTYTPSISFRCVTLTIMWAKLLLGLFASVTAIRAFPTVSRRLAPTVANDVTSYTQTEMLQVFAAWEQLIQAMT
jgi:hypothetical protein